MIDQHDGPQPREWEPAMASVLEPGTERANPQTCPVNCMNHWSFIDLTDSYSIFCFQLRKIAKRHLSGVLTLCLKHLKLCQRKRGHEGLLTDWSVLPWCNQVLPGLNERLVTGWRLLRKATMATKSLGGISCYVMRFGRSSKRWN